MTAPGTAALQAAYLTRRSVLSTIRSPVDWIPGFIFPLMLAAGYANQFSDATALPGFPEVDSFLQFVLPATILQGIAIGSANGGTDLALDIENGFFDRLVSSPVARLSILVGRIAGAAAFAAIQATVLMLVFLAFGAPVKSGIAGAVAVVVIAVFLSIAIGGFAVAVALRTGSQEATQALFPLIFTLIFISSAFFPTALMTGWYQTAAEANPFTFIIDPTRDLVISGWSWRSLGEAIGATLLVAAVSLSLSYRMYLRRLRSM